MSIKLHVLTEHQEAAHARLSLHLSKCHIVGNHMSRLNYDIFVISDYQDDDSGCSDIFHLLAPAARDHHSWRHQHDILQPSRNEHPLDVLSLAGHEQLHVQPFHLLLDER